MPLERDIDGPIFLFISLQLVGTSAPISSSDVFPPAQGFLSEIQEGIIESPLNLTLPLFPNSAHLANWEETFHFPSLIPDPMTEGFYKLLLFFGNILLVFVKMTE